VRQGALLKCGRRRVPMTDFRLCATGACRDGLGDCAVLTEPILDGELPDVMEPSAHYE
jgi:hypothetical protein